MIGFGWKDPVFGRGWIDCNWNWIRNNLELWKIWDWTMKNPGLVLGSWKELESTCIGIIYKTWTLQSWLVYPKTSTECQANRRTLPLLTYPIQENCFIANATVKLLYCFKIIVICKPFPFIHHWSSSQS